MTERQMETKIEMKKERKKDERVEQKGITKEKKPVNKEKEPKTVGMVSEDRSKIKNGSKSEKPVKNDFNINFLKSLFFGRKEKKNLLKNETR